MARHYSETRKAAYRASEAKRREISDRRKIGQLHKTIREGYTAERLDRDLSRRMARTASA